MIVGVVRYRQFITSAVLAALTVVWIAPGGWQPRLLVMLEFPSLEEAERWYNSSEYKPLIAMRERAARTQLIIAEGT